MPSDDPHGLRAGADSFKLSIHGEEPRDVYVGRQGMATVEKIRPSFEEIHMRMAGLVSGRSTCKRLRVGCVIASADFRKILAMGYNGNASGLPNTCDSEEVGNCGCFVEGTEVYPSRATMAYRRRYVGDVIRVVTTAGEFTVTPNHPILVAGAGWCSAEFLQKGHYLLGALRDENVHTCAPHHNQAVPIEDAFESLAVARGAVRRAGARHQFHGDGIVDEDVDIVSCDSGLFPDGKPSGAQDAGKPPLSAADVVPSSLSGTSQRGGTISASSVQHPGIVQSPLNHDAVDSVDLSQPVSGLSGQVAGHDLLDRKIDHALALVSAEVIGDLAKDPYFAQSVLHGGVGNTQVLSDICNALAVPVTAHEVLHVERKRWSGHVYNLSTAQNWYNLQVGGIIAHNCIHAEQNAVINCDSPRYVQKIVFTTFSPCKMCAKFIVNLGNVLKVYYAEEYRIREGLEVLDAVGIKHELLELVW